MKLLVLKEYGFIFSEKIVDKFIRDVLLKLMIENFSILNMWLQVEFGLDESVTCEDIIKFALKHIRIIEMSSHYRIEFDEKIFYPKTTIRMITLLKALTYGNRFFRGNPIILDEIKQLNKDMKSLYMIYSTIGVVI